MGCVGRECVRQRCLAEDAAFRKQTPSIARQRLLTHALICNSTPPCATELLFQSSFFSREASRCTAWRRDEDWPTWEPHVRPADLPARRGFWEVLRLLPNRTVWLHGDSVQLQLCDAAICSLFRRAVARAPLLTAATSPLLAELAAASGLNFVGLALPNGAALLCSGVGLFAPLAVAPVLRRVDVALLNFGLHYHSEESLREMQRSAFRTLERWRDALPARRLALWRETSAQHFAGGAYSSAARRRASPGAPCACEPLVDAAGGGALAPSRSRFAPFERHVANLNVAAVRHERSLSRRRAIGLVPFFNLTAPRYDMHRGVFCSYSGQKKVGSCCDCTHFCYTPAFWDAVFDGMRAAVLREMARHRAPPPPPARPRGLDRLRAAWRMLGR
ncbi:hypothetical protein AB1Y20_001863 [Prymnesium parvum]|uniref:Uncharacterized protein n=1 Tax=Prymnesium parvum TaxID=97485 RepID=A0AB34J6A0_PRYPA